MCRREVKEPESTPLSCVFCFFIFALFVLVSFKENKADAGYMHHKQNNVSFHYSNCLDKWLKFCDSSCQQISHSFLHTILTRMLCGVTSQIAAPCESPGHRHTNHPEHCFQE